MHVATLPDYVVVSLPVILSASLRTMYTVEVVPIQFIVSRWVYKSIVTQNQVTTRVNGQDLQMKLDTGASLSIVSEKSIFKNTIPIQPSNISLRTYSGKDLTTLYLFLIFLSL